MGFALHGTRPAGDQTCGYSRNGVTDLCREKAVRHFLWLATDHTSNACPLHADFIRANAPAGSFDEHAFEPDCGMPGVIWRVSEPDQEGFCYFPEDGAAVVWIDEAQALTQERVLELTGAGAR